MSDTKPASGLMIGLPCYTGSIEAETANALLCSAGRYRKISWMVGCCHIGIARDVIANSFLNDDDVDRLLFVDTDIVFTPDDVERVSRHNLPIVAGLYKTRKDTGKPALCAWTDGEILVKDSLLHVRRAATGFMCIHKDALKTIMRKFPDRWYRNDSNEDIYHFFPAQFAKDDMQQRMVVQTDDFGFCDLATEAGLSIHVDLAASVGHKGTKIYRVDFEQPCMAKLNPVLKAETV